MSAVARIEALPSPCSNGYINKVEGNLMLILPLEGKVANVATRRVTDEVEDAEHPFRTEQLMR